MLSGARGHYEARQALFLDARNAAEFAEGQIEGAISVPIHEWEHLYSALEPWLAGRSAVLYGSRDRVGPVDELAAGLAARGDVDTLYIYLGGFEEWREAGLPVAIGPDRVLAPEGFEEEGW